MTNSKQLLVLWSETYFERRLRTGVWVLCLEQNEKGAKLESETLTPEGIEP